MREREREKARASGRAATEGWPERVLTRSLRSAFERAGGNALSSTEGSLCSFFGLPQVCSDRSGLGWAARTPNSQTCIRTSPVERREQVGWAGNPKCEATSLCQAETCSPSLVSTLSRIPGLYPTHSSILLTRCLAGLGSPVPRPAGCPVLFWPSTRALGLGARISWTCKV